MTAPRTATTTVAIAINCPARRAVEGRGFIGAANASMRPRVVRAHPRGVKPHHPCGREGSIYDPPTDVGVACSALTQDLIRLAAIPSISAAGYPESTHAALGEAYELVAELLRDAGVQNVAPLELPGTAPVGHRRDPRARRARRPSCSTATTTSSRRATSRCGPRRRWSRPSATARSTAAARRTPRPTSSATSARCARGTASRRSGSRSIIEGQEEVGGGALLDLPAARIPRRSPCDAMVIADMGSVRPGVPTLTVALRGMAMATIEVTTLAGRQAQRPVRRRRAGRAARRAARARLAARRQRRRRGGRACDREEWTGESYSDDEFRELAEVLPGLPLLGTGGLGSRVWSGPAITVTGHRRAVGRRTRSTPSRRTRARRSTCACTRRRTRRGAGRARRAPRGRLRPFGIALEVHAEETGNGFSADTTGPAYEAARAAMTRGVGDAGGQRRGRRLDPARQRAAGGRAEAPRSCSSAPPTATRTSTRPTSACCSTSSRRRPSPRPRSSASSPQHWS